MPWLPSGHSYPAPGPPQERTRFPAWSKTSTGGAAVQHSPTFSWSARSFASRWLFPVWTIHTLSWSSTHTPTPRPMTQWFGSGFGQRGSTSKRGASTMRRSPSALLWSTACPQPSATSTTAEAAPTITFRRAFFIGSLLLVSWHCIPVAKTEKTLLRWTMLAGIALAFLARIAGAHDIPNDVKVQAFVKPEGKRLLLLVRVPMSGMREVDLPVVGPGFIDLPRADPALRTVARLWLL